MLKNKFTAGALLTLSLPLSAAVSASECGDVTIADMNWNSATLIAHVDQFILQNVFGCNVELVPGDTMATGTSMVEKGGAGYCSGNVE